MDAVSENRTHTRFIDDTSALHGSATSPLFYNLNDPKLERDPFELVTETTVALARLEGCKSIVLYTEPKRFKIPTKLVDPGVYNQKTLFSEEVMDSLLAKEVVRECIWWEIVMSNNSIHQIIVPLEFFIEQPKYRFEDVPIALRRISKLTNSNKVMDVTNLKNLIKDLDPDYLPYGLTHKLSELSITTTEFIEA